MSSASLVIIAVFLAAGVVKGVIGLGLQTLSMALLALWMSPAEAAVLLVVPSFVTNVWQMRPWGGLGGVCALWRRTAGLQWGILAGTLVAAWLLGAPAGAWASAGLGAGLIAYAAWGLAGRTLALTDAQARRSGLWVGACTGAVTAATGVFVVPAVPWLQAIGLSRDALMQAMGLSFTVSTVALAVGLAGNGSYSWGQLAASSELLLPALAGMAFGGALRQRLSPVMFRRCFFLGLVALGGWMLLHALR